MKRTLAVLLCAALLLSCLPIISAGAKELDVKSKFRMLLEDLELDPKVHQPDRYYYTELEKTDDWVLIRGGLTDLSDPNGVGPYHYATVGNKLVYAKANSKPFKSGFGVFDIKSGAFYDLTDAWGRDFSGLRDAWNALAGIAEPDSGATLIGDADLDADLTILDATKVQRYIADLDKPDESHPFGKDKKDFFFGYPIYDYVDYDRDGDFTIIDATAIQRNLADLPKNFSAKIVSEIRSKAEEETAGKLLTNRDELEAFALNYIEKSKIPAEYDDDYFKNHALVGAFFVLGGNYTVKLEKAVLGTDGTLDVSFTYGSDNPVSMVMSPRFVLVEIPCAFNDDIRNVKVNAEYIEPKDTALYTEIPMWDQISEMPDDPAANGYTVLNAEKVTMTSPSWMDFGFRSTPLGYPENEIGYVLMIQSRADLEKYLPGFDKEKQFSDAYFKDYALIFALVQGTDYYSKAYLGDIAVKDSVLYASAGETIDRQYDESGNPIALPAAPFVWTCRQVSRSDVAAVKKIDVWKKAPVKPLYAKIPNESEQLTIPDRPAAEGYTAINTTAAPMSAPDPYLINWSGSPLASYDEGNGYVMLIKSRKELEQLLPGFDKEKKYDDAWFGAYAILGMICSDEDGLDGYAEIGMTATKDSALYVQASLKHPDYGNTYPTTNAGVIPVYTFRQVTKSEIAGVTKLKVWHGSVTGVVCAEITPSDEQIFIPDDLTGYRQPAAVKKNANVNNYTWDDLPMPESDTGYTFIVSSVADMKYFNLPADYYDTILFGDDYFEEYSMIFTVMDDPMGDSEPYVDNLAVKDGTLYMTANRGRRYVYDTPHPRLIWDRQAVKKSELGDISAICYWKPDLDPHPVTQPVYAEITAEDSRPGISEIAGTASSYRPLTVDPLTVSAPDKYNLGWHRNAYRYAIPLNSSETGYVLLIRNRAEFEEFLPGFDPKKQYDDAYFEDHAIIAMLGQGLSDSAEARMNDIALINGKTLYANPSVYYPPSQSAIPSAPICWTFREVAQSDAASVETISFWRSDTTAVDYNDIRYDVLESHEYAFTEGTPAYSIGFHIASADQVADTIDKLYSAVREENPYSKPLERDDHTYLIEGYDESWFETHDVIALRVYQGNKNNVICLGKMYKKGSSTIDFDVVRSTPGGPAETTERYRMIFLSVPKLDRSYKVAVNWKSEEKHSTYNEYEYYVNTDNKVEICAYTGSDAQVTVPAKIENKPVAVIRKKVFADCVALTSFSIPSSVSTIGDLAFSGCTGLKTLSLPSGVKTLGTAAFSGCTALTDVDLPDSITEMGASVFFGCTSLTHVDLPKKLDCVPSQAFTSCTKLTSIGYPDAAGYIGAGSFSGCTALKTMEIPATVTAIGQSAFYGCSALESIDLPAGLTTIVKSAFRDCTALRSITIPAGVKKISEETFLRCTGLKSVSLPEGLATIDSYAFSGCSGITFIRIPDSVKTIGASAFESCTALKSLSIPRGVKTVGMKVAKGCTALERVTFAGEVYPTYVGVEIPPIENESIGASAFEGCTALTTVAMPDGIKTIGSRAFYGCTSLDYISLPSTVTAISDYTFKNCANLITVHQVNRDQNGNRDLTVKTVGAHAFSNCGSLRNISFSDGLTTIDEAAFHSCTSLSSLDLKENLKTIGKNAFVNCIALKKLTVPRSVRTIEDYALGYIINTNNKYVQRSDFTIRGYIGSAAASYASARGIPFEEIVSDPEISFTLVDQYTPDLSFSEEPIGIHARNYTEMRTAVETLFTYNGEVQSYGDRVFAPLNKAPSYYDSHDILVMRVYKGGSVSQVLPDKVTITGDCEVTVDVKRWLPAGMNDTPDSTWSFLFLEIPKLGEPYTVKVNVYDDSEYKNLNGLEYFIYSDEAASKRVEICGYTGLDGDVSVPETIEGIPVTMIAKDAFAGSKIVKNVILPSGVTYLDAGAFKGCTSLNSVTLPAGLKRVQKETFRDCATLRYVYFGDTTGKKSQTTEIGSYAFSGCAALNTINLPAGLTTIEDHAFFGCTKTGDVYSMKEIHLPKTVTSIGERAIGYDKDDNPVFFYIYGYSGTAAENYATENGFQFKPINEG